MNWFTKASRNWVELLIFRRRFTRKRIGSLCLAQTTQVLAKSFRGLVWTKNTLSFSLTSPTCPLSQIQFDFSTPTRKSAFVGPISLTRCAGIRSMCRRALLKLLLVSAKQSAVWVTCVLCRTLFSLSPTPSIILCSCIRSRILSSWRTSLKSILDKKRTA
ncbi:hypothetical protein L596_004823 [Steinernema carpocapsae]|uniref:Uncharacterized protein n=1 Tax=Steinernema carpocapsae TaxID=34508 RepID=A0A4U8V0K9_STECR|nr:hypothetical protein L596_004823 [Steinernema carpocapsae]